MTDERRAEIVSRMGESLTRYIPDECVVIVILAEPKGAKGSGDYGVSSSVQSPPDSELRDAGKLRNLFAAIANADIVKVTP